MMGASSLSSWFREAGQAMQSEQDEFVAIREAAYDGLRLGTYIDRHHSVPVCQLLILPSFENAVSWDVIRVAHRRAGAQARLYRSCWRMDIDLHAMSSPVERLKYPRPYSPTVEANWVVIDRSRVEVILARLRTAPIPLAVVGPRMGCDGTAFELSVGESFCNARISWWGDMPKEWQQLQPIVAELEQLFEQAWATPGEPDASP